MNALEAIKQIENKARELNVQDMRQMKGLKVGQCARQGDVYIHRVADDHSIGEELNRRQIADGVTLGARHVLKGNVKVYEGVKLPSYVNSRYPLGYVFDVTEEGAVLEHPEHAHFDICDKGRYQVTHQMDMRTLQRVSD